MKCPKCGVEMRVLDFRYIGEDKLEQDFSCRSKQCSNYNTVVAKEINPLDVLPTIPIIEEIVVGNIE